MAGAAGSSTRSGPTFFAGGGEMGALIRAFDWSKTAIGPVESWSPALRMMVSFLLANRFPLLLWWGPDYVSIYNDAYRPILGTKHPKSMGQPVRECWSEIWHILKPLIDVPFQGGPATWMEDLELELFRSGFHEETHFTIAYSPVPDDAAQRGIGGVLATVHEITEKVISERRVAALRDLGVSAEARTAEEACAAALATLANHPKDIPFALLYLVDRDGKQARLDGAAGSAFGRDVSPLTVDLDQKTAARWPLVEAMRDRELVVVEDLASRFAEVPPGPWFDPPRSAVVVPVRSGKPNELAALLVAGVSARLQFDDRYRGFFELVAAQIATAIANARAYEEERRRAEALAEIDRAKTTFFSNVSHEFRTPLTLMLGPLEDVLAAPPESLPQRREDLVLVHRNSLRLLRLVNTLLDFSRIEAGRVQASYEPVDLSSLTADLASAFRAAIERAGLRFKVECASLAEPVWVDRDMWEKIVLNLVSNAFKFTFEGEIAVLLQPHGRSAVLEVRDTGTGIPEEEIPRLFDRFHRVEGARGRTHEGTGIGLALVQELARLHGATVNVESAYGVGSTFSVTIPLGSAHLPADRLRVVPALASTALGAQPYVAEALRWLPEGNNQDAAEPSIEMPILNEPATMPGDVEQKRATILFADDNADMRDYVRRLLGGRYEVRTVADGVAALAELEARRPDLLLSDVMMPGLDGIGLVHRVRADLALANLPVILLSARAGEEASIEGIEAGADDYLVKPFSARELFARVRANLEMARLRREVEARTEQSLRDLNEALELQVAERTRALEGEMAERRKVEERLQQSQRLEAIGRLTGGVAHDFNNLLMVIVGQADRIIAMGEHNERLKQMALAVQRAAERGAQLTGQLLSFARRQRLQPVATSLQTLILDIGELVRRAVGETVAVGIAATPGLWAAHLDPAGFESAILNLAINARDAMPNGGRLDIIADNVTLTVAEAARLDLDPGKYIVVRVADTGPGMAPEIQRRAFEPFFTTKDVGQGTGLGLAQIYGFAKQSDGTATIESALGAGTTVSLYLPKAADGPAAGARADEPATPMRGHGRTLLVVEDQPEVCEVIQSFLDGLDFRVLTAPDGPAARALLESEETIDLLLTDVAMPNGVSGLELARDARRLRQDLKVVAISGYLRPADASIADLAGVTFLEKPFRRTELVETIATALGDADADAIVQLRPSS